MDLAQQQLIGNVRGMKGWLKFLGILMIISGVAQALTIIGILWGWLPFWLGLILNQAGSRAQEYVDRNDTRSLVEFTGKLRTYFVVTGVLTIVSICLAVLGAILGLVFGLFAAGGLAEMFKQLQYQF